MISSALCSFESVGMACRGSGSRFDRSSISILSVAPDGSGSGEGQVAHSNQVVGGQREAEHPTDPRHAAMADLARASDGFEPAEDLLDAFTFALADQIAGMMSGQLIDDRGGLAG